MHDIKPGSIKLIYRTRSTMDRPYNYIMETGSSNFLHETTRTLAD
jgi:hypothetical protein